MVCFLLFLSLELHLLNLALLPRKNGIPMQINTDWVPRFRLEKETDDFREGKEWITMMNEDDPNEPYGMVQRLRSVPTSHRQKSVSQQEMHTSSNDDKHDSSRSSN